jgi:hypothetical protein
MMRAAHAGATLLAGAIIIAWPASATGTTVPSLRIPEKPTAEAPVFIGSAATPRPLQRRTRAPRHPFMAPNGRSNVHVDAYQTDANAGSGPLGLRIRRVSSFQAAGCATVTFDRDGRIIATCIGPQGPLLVLLDPRSLDLLASRPLPSGRLYPLPRQPGLLADNPWLRDRLFRRRLAIAGGGYFYLDQRNRVVIPTRNRHIQVFRRTRGAARRVPGLGFRRVRDFDLSHLIDRDDAIVSALPDWSGLIWFVSTDGVVGNVDPGSGRVRSRRLREGVTNSFAVDETGGVYIVSDRALYRFDAGPGGRVVESWREGYDNVGYRKRGQADDGSGTTPTLMGEDYVAIADNANPMNVMVYRRGERARGEPRLVCKQPVFRPGASATDNSLVVTDRSIVVENNFGFSGPDSVSRGRLTAPGIERVDLDRDGSGCHTAWRSREVSPSVVPKLSLANGLLYAYTKTRDRDDPWYLTAIDFRRGATVYRRRAGFGRGYNNHYAPITLGPEGTAYVGVANGLVALRDTARGR